MKKTFIAMSVLFGMMMSAQNSLERLKVPAGENLLINPTFQENPDQPGYLSGWSAKKGIKFSWIEENGRKLLRAETSTPGYHLGINQQVRNLKSNTEYLIYLVARGKIADGSVRTLSYTGKLPGVKKAVFAGGAGGKKTDFPWQLFQGKFRTPSDFKDGVCSLYAVLFTGSCQIDIAQAGIVEYYPKTLSPPPVGAANLLNNPDLKTSSQTPGFPYDWNSEFAEHMECYGYEQDKDGNGIVTLLPYTRQKENKIGRYNSNSVVFQQRGLTLHSGKKYRIGAMIQTKDFKASRSGIIIYNFAWTKSTGTESIPENTNGWKRIEADVILPKSRGEDYYFAVYTVGCTSGEIKVKSPYLIPLDADAAANIRKAPKIHTLNRITPIDPLLSRMSAEKPRMLFSFRSVLPKAENEYQCLVRIKSREGENLLAKGVFPLKDSQIQAEFPKLIPEKVFLEVALIDKQTGKTFASDRYPAELLPPMLSRPAERRLNMLTQRLLTAEAKDGKYVFSAPRDGWIYIALSAGKSDTLVKLDGYGAPVIKALPCRRFETLRRVKFGDHTLEIVNGAGGKLIVNSIPEIMASNYPYGPEVRRIAEVRHREFLDKYFFPNITTIDYGYRVTKAIIKELSEWGKDLFRHTVHLKGRTRFESPKEMAKRLMPPKLLESGFNFDEIYMEETNAKWIITQAMELMTDAPVPLNVCSSGVKADINPLNTAFFSAIANNAGGRGKINLECYARTQASEEKADLYLKDLMNKTIHRLNQLMPGGAKYVVMTHGFYTNAGIYCTDTFAGPDVKAFWNKMFYKWANEEDFKDMAGIGVYSWIHGNEESLRWATKLVRHYVIEGNKDDLAAKYGYSYLPGHLKDGDFTEGLTHWKAVGAVKALTVKNLGKKYQRRMWLPVNSGDTACIFTRSDKSPNTLTAKISGLTPGKQYVLRYLLVDYADIKANKPSRKKIYLCAKLDGAQNITAASPLAKYCSPDGIHISGYVNNVALVFKAEKPEVLLTFSDWADKLPGGTIGQEILLNKVGVTPYFSE